MKIFILLAILSAVSAQNFFGFNVPKVPSFSNSPLLNRFSQIPLLNNVQDFGDFVAQSGKQYATAAEKTLREGIFRANQALIDSNNKAWELGQSAFKLGANIFADLSPTEFLSKLAGLKRSSAGDAKASAHKEAASVPTNANIPDSFDWRDHGAVTPVKFQGLDCNSCWSFAVTGAVEGHYFRKTKSLVPLSEQNLIDCSQNYGNVGCSGGYQEYGFNYIIENQGIAKSEPYPYKMMDDKCNYRRDIKGADMQAFAVIAPGDEKTLKEAVATKGPVACSMCVVETFVLYEKGIYDDQKCNEGDVNHSVLVIGYGTENGRDYWIIKNSYSDKWGEGGYGRIPRNENSFCGIASECSYPIIN
ncbi:procathepsin L-like [Episyrphus balteatus]|uniref:procathepsin L-like n=1 Tax=Episyrphus balteatus TaxID=286459 RepID=UPI002484F741|nr:procathepsin L-like [Episyrphus balteatus]